MFSCSNDLDKVVSKAWEKCKNNTSCIVDFADLMTFEWDTMCFYSVGYSLEEINENLGFELREWRDVGDRVIFLNKGKVVYHQEWFPTPSKPPKGTRFVAEYPITVDRFKFKIGKPEAKFEVIKNDKAFYLRSIR